LQSAQFIRGFWGINNLVSFKPPAISVSFCSADTIFASTSKLFAELFFLLLIVVVVTASISPSVVCQPFCDESGVGFATHLAENIMPLWSHHLVLRSDETWLPEWSDNLGGERR
jgi:hypothetical protein